MGKRVREGRGACKMEKRASEEVKNRMGIKGKKGERARGQKEERRGVSMECSVSRSGCTRERLCGWVRQPWFEQPHMCDKVAMKNTNDGVGKEEDRGEREGKREEWGGGGRERMGEGSIR